MDAQPLRRLLARVRKLRFSEEAQIDLSDRLALISVPAGLRRTAAFGFRERKDEENKRALIDAIEASGLTTLVTGSITRNEPSGLVPELAAVFDQVDAESNANSNDELLWVVLEESVAAEVKEAVSGKADAGILLGYPKCCVERERARQSVAAIRFQNAIVQAAGTDPEAIRRALLGNLKVDLPADTFLDKNAPLTHRVFPFVFHIACDECLSDAGSATGRINDGLRSLAQQVDRAIFQATVDMSRVAAEVEAIISEAEAKGLGPGQLDPGTDRRLQELLGLRRQIHARSLAT